MTVPETFDRLPWRTIDKAFITLMAMLDEIIKHYGKKQFPDATCQEGPHGKGFKLQDHKNDCIILHWRGSQELHG